MVEFCQRFLMMTFPLLMVILSLLGGCIKTSKAPDPPGLAYLMKPRIHLRVGRIEVFKKYRSPPKEVRLDLLFPLSPGDMLQQWIQDRFTTAGGEGVAAITIEDARVVEKRLTPTTGLTGLFTIDQSERYDARVAVMIEIKDARGYPLGYARAAVVARRGICETMSLDEREQVFIALMEDLMNQLDQEVEKNMREYLFKFIAN